MQGGVIWITGLSGVGKSTLAEKVVCHLRQHGTAAVLLDGDAMREALGEDRFDRGSREQMAFRYARLAWLIAAQGFVVVVATISLFHAVHDFNRTQARHYLEVLVEADPALRAGRSLDRTGGPRVGGEILAEFPLLPHLRLMNDAATPTLDRHAETIVHLFRCTDARLHC